MIKILPNISLKNYMKRKGSKNESFCLESIVDIFQ
jgi:hypothetical protein